MPQNIQHGSQRLCWNCALRKPRSLARYSSLADTLKADRAVASWSRKPTLRSQARPTGSTLHVLPAYRFASVASQPKGHERLPFTFTREVANNEPRLGDPASKIRQELRLWHAQNGQLEQDDLDQYFGAATEDDPEAERVANPDENADGIDDLELAMDSPDLDEFDPHHRMLRAGDLVEIQFADKSKDPLIGVFVRRLGLSRVRQFFTANGRWLHSVESAAAHVIPNYIDPELVNRMIPYLPNTDEVSLREQMGTLYDISVPREFSGPVISRLLKFQNEVQDLYRRNAARLDDAHLMLADEDDIKTASIAEIASFLLQRDPDTVLTPVELSTVRLALTRGGYAFAFDPKSARVTGIVAIRPKSKVAMVHMIRDWVRQYRDELAQHKVTDAELPELKLLSYGGRRIQSFLRKARSVIAESRQDREATQMGTVGPSKHRYDLKTQPSALRFTDGAAKGTNYRQLMRFMEIWVNERGFQGLSNLESSPPLLLKGTGMYGNLPLETSTGNVFLQEMGRNVPWENRMVHDETVLLPTSGHSSSLARLAADIHDAKGKTETELMLSDTLKDIRNERTDPITYCLDSAGALEIDDGISIDPPVGGTTWVHIEVANPTAFLSPDGKIAKVAQHMAETIYMPDESHMMLPTWMTQKYMSLDSGRPCLRFSARLDEQGVVVEYNVSAGYSQQVKFVEPSEVNKALELKLEERKTQTLCVGGTPPKFTPKGHEMLKAGDMTTRMKDDLRRLLALADKRSIVRSTKDGINLNSSDRDVQVWVNPDSPGLRPRYRDPARARFVQGDPIIVTETKAYSPWMKLSGTNDARGMVQEYMLLSSYVASKWMHDRGLPNVYRGSLPKMDNKETPSQYYTRVLAPAAAENGGMIPQFLYTDYMARSSPSTISMDPLKHDQLSLTHYSRVTSPLRRYSDMLTHWQIEAALLEEARTGRPVRPSEAESVVPFSRARLESFVPMLQSRETRIKHLKQWGIKFWIAQLMFRGVHFGELDLPRTLEACVTQVKGPLGWSSTIMEYDFPCLIKSAPADTRPGDEFEVQIVRVDVYPPTIEVRPLRLLRRAKLYG